MNSTNVPDWLVRPGAGSPQSAIGTKAFNLSILEGLGFAVPPCVFITTLNSDTAPFESAEAYLSSINEFSPDLARVLPSSHGWAVRSSATVEDLPGESHAGRFSTLFISAAADLAGAVKTVWDSGRSADIGPESMGVVIQQLVDASVAGVAFSHDPTRIDDHRTVIEGVPGNAARFVDGELTPWRVRPGTPDVSLPDNVGVDLIEALDDGVQRLAASLKMAVDTEWAWSGGQLYWLQVRPLTGSRSTEFVVPESQKPELRGLWVRINHSFAPQVTLIASMNPGGYFDGPGWTSRLVNNFHYIQEEKKPGDTVPTQDFDSVLDEWDQWEGRFEKMALERRKVDFARLDGQGVWEEILRRVELAQEYFRHYSDRRFLEIRDRSQKRVNELVKLATENDLSPESIAGQLLGQLGSLTEEKRRRLQQLARQHALDPKKDIRDTREWFEFMELFGFESPTPHLFYLPTLSETPELVVEMVKQMSQATHTVRDAMHWQAIAKSVADGLSENDSAEFQVQLARLRRCMLRTENDDYGLAKCTMLVREAFLEAGRRLVAKSKINDVHDVFHLAGPELSGALSGGGQCISESSIRERKKDFEKSRLLSPPPMIMNGRAMTPKDEASKSMLKGTPASAGIASGIALVLNDPFSCVGKQFPKNSVIVAPVVTPALAYSLMGCAAIVTEIGGLASHGAIVAREMAIPAVVGVGRARAKLQTGMSVTVDGSRGEVHIQVTRS